MLGKIFNKIKAAVPKVINAISKKVKEVVNEVVNDVSERNERIVEKVKEAAKNTSLYLERGTVTIGAVGPYNKKNHIILDFLFQVKDAVVEEYPILTWPNDKLKQGIGYIKDAFATGEKQVGGLIYDLDIPFVSDFVGAFTDVREPGAESNRASMEGASWRGFLIKGAGGTLEGLATFAADPLEAVEGINKIVAYPEEMLPAIGKGVVDYWDTKIVNGSPEDRAEASGQAIFEIASMFIGVGEVKAATKVASTGMDVARMADKVSDVVKVADKISDVAKVTDKVSDVAKVADKAVDLGRYQASLKGLGKKLAQNIDEGILTQGRAFSDSIDNLISAMNKHTSTPYPAYAGLGKLDDVGKTADKFEDWYSSVKKSMMKTDSAGGSGVKVSGPVDELNPKALNEAGEQIAKGADKAVDLDIGKKDLDILRNKLGIPEKNTIAVAKTNVKGLEEMIFEGGSPAVRKDAGLPNYDISNPNRAIKSSGKIPSATRHAEEVVANEFVEAVEKAGIEAKDVVGALRVHQSNPSGVCPTCLSGLGNPDKTPGVIKQLSLKYPNLTIEVTSEVVEGAKVNGRLAFKVKNGMYID